MTRSSDIEPYYKDDFITLYNADCLENPELWCNADVLITDPPYGINWSPRHLHKIMNDNNSDARDSVLRLYGEHKPGLVFGSYKVARPANTRIRLLWLKNEVSVGDLKYPWGCSDE